MKIKRGGVKKIMLLILCVIAVLIAAVVIFFQIPYSPTKSEVHSAIERHSEQSAVRTGIFAERDIEHLPEPIQNHFKAAGIIGSPIMPYVTVEMTSATLINDGREMSLDYTLHLFGYRPVRLAYMNTSMFGLPFEGLDSFQDGEGFMRGVIGKVFTLFNQTGPEMDKGQLLTYLSEVLLIPCAAVFSEYIVWEPIDANHAKATITYGELSGSGIFTFGEDGFFQSFRTDERARIATDGTIDFPEWSALVEGWQQGENGIYAPRRVKAVWHDGNGDLVYFDADNVKYD